MKYNLFLKTIFIAGYLMISCHNDVKSHRKALRTFDIKRFQKLQNNGRAEFTNGDTIVELSEERNEFVEVIKFRRKPNYSYYYYDKKSKRLIKKGKYFYNFPVGTEISYNEAGDVVDEIDYDRSFAFSVGELINKMATDYKIDINDSINNLSINRAGMKKGKPKYIIRFKPDEFGRGRAIEIDGTTGDVIRDFIAHYVEW